MSARGERRGMLPGLALCALTLALCVLLQHTGYLVYLDGDIASEAILARREADTGSLVQTDWLYSTEIRLFGPTQLYALGFRLGMGYRAARVFGNTLMLALGMAACAALCRMLRLPWGASLSAAALIPVTASDLYAYAVTAGGFYAHHWLLAMLTVTLWLRTLRAEGRLGRRAALYALCCALLGAMSVRYALCFVCPMLAAAVLDAIFCRENADALVWRARFAGTTALGFAACAAGYAASQVLLPRLFMSGMGAAGSFAFQPLDGPTVAQTLFTALADLLKLMGWRGGVRLFSPGGLLNLCIAGVLFMGAALLVRALRGAREDGPVPARRRMLLLCACAALLVNLFCFLFIEGAYLSRYLIPAALFFVPALPVALAGEENKRLRGAFVGLLCAWLALAAPLLLMQTRAAQPGAKERAAGMQDTIDFLQDAGYTHGYGTFWNVRVMQELSGGALTFAGVVPTQTEEGALVPCAPEFIRWLEPDEASDLNACAGKTFLILTRAEEAELSDWLMLCAAPRLHESADYAVYGFDSSAGFWTAALLGRATLEQGEAGRTGGGALTGVTLQEGGRLRVPPYWREAGSYVLRFSCEGEPAADSEALAYTGKGFEVLAQRPISAGENALAFTLSADDKYFMLQLRAGGADGLRLTDIRLEKAE